jgi:hypothetical protein
MYSTLKTRDSDLELITVILIPDFHVIEVYASLSFSYTSHFYNGCIDMKGEPVNRWTSIVRFLWE